MELFIFLFARFVTVSYFFAVTDSSQYTSIIAILTFTISSWVFIESKDKQACYCAGFNNYQIVVEVDRLGGSIDIPVGFIEEAVKLIAREFYASVFLDIRVRICIWLRF